MCETGMIFSAGLPIADNFRQTRDDSFRAQDRTESARLDALIRHRGKADRNALERRNRYPGMAWNAGRIMIMTERAYGTTSAQPGGEVSVPLISETYATLINRKALIPSVNTPYFAIEQHLFFRLMEVALEGIDLDEDWYVSRNSDVADAIRNGSVRDAGHHYRRFGFYEHRLPYAIAVAEAWYLEVYDDVREGLLRKAFPSAQSHFETMGFREGRLPYPNFALARRMPWLTAPPHPVAASPAAHAWPEIEA